jgi:CHAT domain-containing protein/Tfp pilus assembly protein PilF
MKHIFAFSITLGLCLTPLTAELLLTQVSSAQAQDLKAEMQKLQERALQQTTQRKPLQAIATFQQLLDISRQRRDLATEAASLFGIGINYYNLGQRTQALNHYNQALSITQMLGDQTLEVIILNNIGLIYQAIGQPQQALDYFNKSLKISQQAKDLAGEAISQSNIGGFHQDIGQLSKALVYYNQVLPIFQGLSDCAGEATTLNNIGSIYQAQGKSQQARDYFNKALPILRKIRDRSVEAKTLGNIGLTYQSDSQPHKALEHLNQALVIVRQIDDREGKATQLNNIGAVYQATGKTQQSLEYFNQALIISKQIDDRRGEAITLSNIGEVYRITGQPKKSIETYLQALKIDQETNNRSGEATTLNNIGSVYYNYGEPEKSLDSHEQALAIFQKLGNRFGEGATLNNIGEVYRIIGQPQKALEYYQKSLPIRQEVGDKSGEAVVRNNIGVVYQNAGQLQKALKWLEGALPLFREVNNRLGEASALNNIGEAYRAIGQPKKALDYLNQALPIRRVVGDRVGEASTLHNFGGASRDLGQSKQALEYFNQALSIRQTVGDLAGKTSTLNNIALVYQMTNQPKEAITYFEKALGVILDTRRGLRRDHRRSFLDDNSGIAIALTNLLSDNNQPDKAFEWINLATTADLADYTRIIDAKVTNPLAQQAINELDQKNQQLQSLYQQLQQPGGFSEALASQVRDLETQINQRRDEVSKQFPEIAELFESMPKDIAQLRASIPSGITVVYPVLLTDVTYVPDTIALFILTKDTLTVQKIPVDPKQFDTLLSQTYAQLTDRHDDLYLQNLVNLYDLLIRPIEAQIQATNPKQISIIATGKLRYLPFEALYDSKTNQYLLQKYPVNYLTRLSTRSLAAKPNTTTPKRILALGNPISTAPLALPGAETEVKSIVDILPGSEAMLGAKATLAAFKVQSLRFPLLHLATHGCFQKGGCPKLGLGENTILFADQQFNIADAALLGLQNVDLITLSACQTALETNSNGEEISGLAYLFERAGAKATIASLWSAEDTTTQAIMVQFYQNLKKGMSKGEALQQAKLSQIDSHPFFWAPFVLIGDAR